jgi:hypothetical protein
MSDGTEKACRGNLDQDVMMLLASGGCVLVELDDIVQAIREAGRGKRWAWVDKWVNEEGPKYVNDMDTVFFDFPSVNLTREKSLEFTQGVWRCKPSVFEYQVWSSRCFVRMWWDRSRSGIFPEGGPG